jgi:hypothetical protein
VQGIEIEGRTSFESCAELNTVDCIERGQSCETHLWRAERSRVLHRVIQRTLFPPRCTAGTERSRRISGSEVSLA